MSDLSGQSQYSFQDIFEALASTRSFEDVLDVILATALRELEADQGSLLLLDDADVDSSTLRMLAAHGLPQEIVQRGYVQRKGSISEYVLRERRPLVLNDVPRTRNYESMAAETSTPRSIVSALCVPLVVRGRVLGTMNLNRTQKDRRVFSQDDLEAGSIIAGQAALTIENRRLQDELLQKERLAAVGETVAGISHCIKNILSGVKGGLGITQMGLDHENPELVRQGYDLLKRNVGTLGNLVMDLLDYSKEREPYRTVFNVRRTLDEVVGTVAYKAAGAGVNLSVEADGSLEFYGDSDQIFRAILNLVTNAVEACGDFSRSDATPPRVTVKAESLPPQQIGDAQRSNMLQLQVEDTGLGIPEEVRVQIWDLFFSTKGSRGTGIGLAAARKMIEEHQGTIELESNPSWGTRFIISLPMMASSQEDG